MEGNYKRARRRRHRRPVPRSRSATACSSSPSARRRSRMAADAARDGLLVDFGGVLTTNVFDSFEASAAARVSRPASSATVPRRPARPGSAVRAGDGRARRGGLRAPLRARSSASSRARASSTACSAACAPDEEMFDAVRAPRRRGPHRADLEFVGRRPLRPRALRELFDAVVISGEEGIRKPDRRSTSWAPSGSGCAPRMRLRRRPAGNLKPARELGMETVHHTSAPETARALDELLPG